MKKILTFSLIMFIFSVMNIMAANTWYVDPLGTDNGTHGTGTGANAFHTIQYAINDSRVFDGDIINVAIGIYHERITISKSLDIRGAQYGVDPTLTGARTNPANESTIDVVGLSVPNPDVLMEIPAGITHVLVSGFSIIGGQSLPHNADQSAVRCWDDYITIQDNIIDGYTSILYEGNDYFTVVRNRITSNKGCIIIQPNVASHLTISYNKLIKGSSPESDCKPMYMTGVSYATISYNTASDFTGYAALSGSNHNHFDIIGNTFTGCQKGISFWGGVTFFSISGNTITNSSSNGIEIKGQDITISNNFITNNYTGILVDYHVIPTQRVNISNNSISGSTTLAIQVGTSVTEMVNASGNWFGSNNPSTIASKVTASLVDYTPFLNNGTDIQPLTTGFQGDFSTLWVSAVSPQSGSTGYIQEGVNLVTAGGTVNVLAGTYKEQVNITKGLTLIGDVTNPDNVIVDGENKTTLANDGQVRIYNPTGDVVFKGFKIINTGISSSGLISGDGIYLGILTNGSYSTTVQNCKIIGHGSSLDVGWDYGFWAYEASGALIIKDCYFSEMYHGILLEKQTGAATLENNTFNNLLIGLSSGSYYGGRAIEAITYGGTNITSLQKVSGNTFTNFKSTGIIFSGGFSGEGIGKYTNVVIENNNFSFSASNIVNNYGAINLRNVSTGNSDPNGGVTADIHNNTINVPSSSGIQVSGLNGTITCHNNNIFGVPYNFKADAALGTIINATNNWWGTAVEAQIIAKLSGNVLYNPWTGSTSYPADVIPCTVGTHNLTNSNPPGGSIQFNSVGTNNINPSITVQRHDGLPNVPAYAGTAAPVYFVITPTNLANYTFEATITIDVSAIPGFNGNTVIMMSPDGINNWVGVNGTYNSSAHTFTFTTSHFSTIAFVNPVLDNTLNLYVSTSTSTYSSTIYPNISWNTPLSTGTGDAINWTPSAANHDWTYKSPKLGTFYLIPVGSSTNPRSFYEAHIKVAWNPNVISGVTINPGNLFPGGTFLQNINMGNGTAQIDYASLDGNHTPDGQLYLAKIDFNFDNDTSGFSPIAIQDVTIYYDNGQSGWENAMVVTQGMGGKFKLYLGDFASTSPASLDMGDGLIDATDLTTSGFTQAYWSNYNDNNTKYLSKFDIGPTLPARYYFGLPHPDGVINFEDLAVFAMGYSKTGSGSLPDNPKPIIFSLDKIARDANGTLRLPVRISGNVNDVRALSMKLKYGSDMEYTGVEMAGEMLQGTKFLIGKSESGKAFMDGAVIGAFESGLSKEGVIAYVLFNEKQAGNHSAMIESVIARNSSNLDLDVSFDGMNNGLGVPKTFNLSQNYPNPFNPVTKIEYAVPNDVKVTLKIYDVLGREVNVLVNEVKKAGYYSVEWNGSSLSSGIYFYQMKAGDFVAVKKMMMIK